MAKGSKNTMRRVDIKPKMLIWARERSGLHVHDLINRFPKLSEWESGTLQPTLRQAEEFARATHVSVGYLFLPSPPQEKLPITDFRTLVDDEIAAPSPNMLEMIYICQQRQEWFREYARLYRLPELDFVGSATVKETPKHVAEEMRQTLKLSVEEHRKSPNWTTALRNLIDKAEDAGILVMVSGVVGSNNRRRLDVEEFRGFALADNLAPLIFINGTDSKAAQMFTLCHEMAHLWLGRSGVSDTNVGNIPELDVEQWCNEVAAEFLVPLEHIRQEFDSDNVLEDEMERLARMFKVSTLVILRRLFDADLINRDTLWNVYQEELFSIRSVEQKGSGGGNYYRTLGARTGKRFVSAVLTSTLEGQTLFQDAFRMLGMRKSSTFYNAAREMGVLL
jgi:Zn-dependent peptidase ImmA (M78 family)